MENEVDLGPGLEELLLGGLYDDAVGVAHHGDQHVEQEDGDQDLGTAQERRIVFFLHQTIYIFHIYYFIIMTRLDNLEMLIIL